MLFDKLVRQALSRHKVLKHGTVAPLSEVISAEAEAYVAHTLQCLLQGQMPCT